MPRSAAPAWRPSGRPALTHGVQSGDATADSAVVWTRADRAGRLHVEVSRRPDFRGARRIRGPLLGPSGDFTGKVRLRELPAGERLHYRVRVESMDRPGLFSEPLVGSLRTAPGSRQRSDLRFVWSGDIVGQGWGISSNFGGMKIFESMRAVRPDFFLCSGDTVYADGPLTETVTLPDGRIWRNLVTPEKSKVAETLAEYRGQFAYNLLDEHLRAFAAEVPQINQWDDHEVTNNWYPGEILVDSRYTEKRVDVLAARARQAFHEWLPTPVDGRLYRRLSYGPLLDVFVLDMRTYKDPNDGNTYADPNRGLLGRAQREWLIRELKQSRATWKVIANDLPIGLVVPDGSTAQEGVAQGDHGLPAGRELEFAEVLRTAHRDGVTRDRLRHRGRALHGRAPLRPGSGRGARLHPVLGVRLRAGARRCLRPERPGRDVRPEGGLRATPRRPPTPHRPTASSTSARSPSTAGPATSPSHLRDRDGRSSGPPPSPPRANPPRPVDLGRIRVIRDQLARSP